MTKKFNALLASAVVVSSVAVPAVQASTQTFTDVPTTHSHYESIHSLASRGIINGYEDGTFKPSATLTRGQAAKILAGVLKLDTSNKTVQFSDVPEGYEHIGAINALFEKQIINGYEDQTFKPNAPLTRGQMAKILVNAFNLTETNAIDLPFTDVSANNGFKQYIEILVQHQITNGTSATTYGPSQAVTRGQMASFILRAESRPVTTDNEQTTGFETITISSLTNTVNVGDKNYTYVPSLAPIFNEANKLALKNATATVRIVNNEIVAITDLTLNTSGTLNNLVTFRTNNEKLLENLTINADYVRLSKVAVKQNITLTQNAVHEFHVADVKADGELLIHPQAGLATASLQPLANSNGQTWLRVFLTNSTLPTIQTLRDRTIFNGDREISSLTISQNVRQVEINVAVNTLQINAADTLTINGTTPIQAIQLQSATNVNLTSPAQIAAVTITNPNAQLQLGTNTRINTLTIPENSTPESIIQNFVNVQKAIQTIQIREASTNTVTPSINTPNASNSGGGSGGSGGGGGGGGSSSSQTTPTISAISNLAETITIGDSYTLPTKISATMSNGTKQDVTVSWNSATPSFNTIGETIIEGTVSGYAQKVKLTVTVKEASKAALIDLINRVELVDSSADGLDIEPTRKWTTADVKEAFMEALTIAENLSKNQLATEAQIAAGITSLQGAITAYETAQQLGRKPAAVTVDKVALQSAISNAQAVVKVTVSNDGSDIDPADKWTTQAVLDAFNTAISDAQAVLADADATQSDVDNAVNALNVAVQTYENAKQDGLKPAVVNVDTSTLQSAISNAQAIVKVTVSNDGTDVDPADKWITQVALDAFNQAISDAEVVLADTNATQDAVNAAVSALNAAVQAYNDAQQPGTQAPAKPTITITSSVAIQTDDLINLVVDGQTTHQVSIAATENNGSHTLTMTFEDDPVDVANLPATISFAFDGTSYVATKENGAWTLSALLVNNVLAEVTANGISLKWDPTMYATGYSIYRADANGSFSQLQTNITAPNYTDDKVEAGVTYKYKVAATNIVGESAQSDKATVTANLDEQGPLYVGNYAVISNNSPLKDNKQTTGAITVQPANTVQATMYGNMPSSTERSLDLEAYRMNPVLEAPLLQPKGRSMVNESIQSTTATTTTYNVGDSKSFYLNNRSNNSWYQNNATLLYIGKHSEIWVHDNSITTEDAAKIATEFDTNIYGLVTTNFAPVSDIDGNKRVAILTLDIIDNFDINDVNKHSFTGGYFSSADLYNANQLHPDDKTNEMEIFYIDTYPSMGTDSSKPDVTQAYSTLVHEFQHMVNANQERIIEKKGSMNSWLNEALSMAAEQMYAKDSPLTSRISYYSQPLANDQNIQNGLSVLNWKNSLSNYSLSYLFGQYLKIQANQGYIDGVAKPGDAIFKEILVHTKTDPLDERTSEQAAVEAIIRKYIDPEMSFEQLLKSFRLALVLKADTGLYGFGGKTEYNSLITQTYTGGEIMLDGGGAIVVDLNGGSIEKPSTKGEDITFTGVFNK